MEQHFVMYPASNLKPVELSKDGCDVCCQNTGLDDQ